MSTGRKIATRLASSFLPLFLFILIPALGIWMSVLRGGQIANLTTVALSNKSIQMEIGAQFAKNIIENSDSFERKALTERKSEIEMAVVKFLAEPKTQKVAATNATLVYEAVTAGKKTVVIDFSSLADDAVNALNKVPGMSKFSKKELGDIKPMTLGKDGGLPDLSAVHKGITALAFGALLLALFLGGVIAWSSKNPFKIIGMQLTVVGFVWTSLYFAGFRFLDSKLTDNLQKEVIPIIARETFSGVRLLGLLFLVTGLAALLFQYFKEKDRTDSV